MKFIHKFNSALSCEVEILDRRPEPGEQHILRVQWTGDRKKKHYPEYVRWMHTVNDCFAKRWEIRIMHCFQLSSRPEDWQFWGYSPEEPPKRIVLELQS